MILIGSPTTKAGDVGNHQNLGPTPITPEGILKLSALPWTEEVQITDTLKSSQPSATYKIPVGPTTKSFKVTVDPSEPTEGPEVPAIDQLYLVSPTGTILVAMQGVAANVQGNHQAIDISLNNVPAGAQLLVHVGEQAIFSASESVPNPPPAAGVDLAFRMDVHRNDPGGYLFLNYVGLQAAGPLGPSAGVLISAGGILSTPTSLELSPTSQSASSETAGESPNSGESLGEVLLVAEEIVTAPGVSLGPLVSQGAAPVGPNLGTTQDQRTSAIDRHERASDLAMEQLGGDLDARVSPARDAKPTSPAAEAASRRARP